MLLFPLPPPLPVQYLKLKAKIMKHGKNTFACSSLILFCIVVCNRIEFLL